MTRLVADALTKGAVPRAAAAAGLGGRELTLMGGTRQSSSTRLTPLSPIATVVRSRAPRVPLVRASRRAELCRHHLWAGFRSRDGESDVTDTSWTATSALKPGVTYQWQVTADTPEAPFAPPRRPRRTRASASSTRRPPRPSIAIWPAPVPPSC